MVRGTLCSALILTSHVTLASGPQLPQIQNGDKNRPFSRVTVQLKRHGILQARSTEPDTYLVEGVLSLLPTSQCPAPYVYFKGRRVPGTSCLPFATAENKGADLRAASLVLPRHEMRGVALWSGRSWTGLGRTYPWKHPLVSVAFTAY